VRQVRKVPPWTGRGGPTDRPSAGPPPDGGRRGHRVTRLIEAGQWRAGDPAVRVIFDARYDAPRLAFLLADPPVEVLGRLPSGRVLYLPASARPPGTSGRPRSHGGEFALADPATWAEPPVATTTQTTRYGTAVARAWDRPHPRLTHRSAWLDHDGASRARGPAGAGQASPRPRAGDDDGYFMPSGG
jgi:hypothetical protein